jgi:hypothetical protein
VRVTLNNHISLRGRMKPVTVPTGKNAAKGGGRPAKASALISRRASTIEASALMRITNKLFNTDCYDPDSIDFTDTWTIIVEELSPYYQSSLTLAIRYRSGMNLSKAGNILGVTRSCVHQRCERALRHLRDPRRINRIRDSIIGLQNLYRNNLA